MRKKAVQLEKAALHQHLAVLGMDKLKKYVPPAARPQHQGSLVEQLRELVTHANENGLYDAADYLNQVISRGFRPNPEAKV